MFYDQEKQTERKYTPPVQAAGYTEGDDQLTVKVGKEVLKDKTAGIVVTFPRTPLSRKMDTWLSLKTRVVQQFAILVLC